MKKQVVVIFLIFNCLNLFSSDGRHLKSNGFQWGYYALAKNAIRSTPDLKGKIICMINAKDEIFVNEDESTDNWFYCYINKYNQYGYCEKQYFEKKKTFSSVMYLLLNDDSDAIEQVKKHKVNSCYMDDIFYWFETQNEENILKMVKYAYECGSYETKNTNPVILATLNNYKSILLFLLDKPEFQRDVNSREYDQFGPPLFWSLDNGNKEITEILLKYGANPNFTTADNKNAYKVLDDCINNNKITMKVANELKQMLADYGYQLENSNAIKIDNKLTVTENLRLRTIQGAVLIITTIKQGSPVKVKILGKYETIDGINSRWVYVEVQPGAQDRDGKLLEAGLAGWCFGGYLE